MGRFFHVNVDGSLSLPYPVTSGVPQGSVLGPLCFNIFVSDVALHLPQYHGIHIKQFADDIKLYSIYTQADAEAAKIRFQTVLDAFCEWSKNNDLTLSAEKCCIIHLGHKNPLANYTLHGNPLSVVESVRDLGILVSRTLQPKPNIEVRISKSLRALHSLLRAIQVNDFKLLVKCYKTYILPIVEFGSQIWSPHTKKGCLALERVQKLFTRIVCARCHIQAESYQERCLILGLHSLEKRRIMADLATSFKILTGSSPLKLSKFFRLRVSFGRNSAARLHPRVSKTELRRHCFSQRCSRWLRILPSHVLASSSLKSFKKNIKLLDLANI